MNAASPIRPADAGKRERLLITPEGLALPLTIASRGARAGALLLDLTFVTLGFIALIVLLALAGISLFATGGDAIGGPVEALEVLLILLFFVSRYGYFMWFELGPRAATPGKRLLGIRVAARPIHGDSARPLTAEMVVARNLLRDVEVNLPAMYLLTVLLGAGPQLGVSGWALLAWLMIFLLFPFFNRDALRAGDLVAGTWVVEAQRAKLQDAMSLAPDRSTQYRFGPEELSVYGEHELQVLENVLRQGNEQALAEVAQTIARKIGWDYGGDDDREFLESFYAALRGHLEGGLRFGKRKKDKHASG